MSVSVCLFVCMSVSSGNQHAMRVWRIILPTVACPNLQYFSTLHCQLWPAPVCNIFPHYIANCGLPQSAIFSHITLPTVACPSLQYFPTLHCQLWPAPICNIFPHYPINGMIFGGGCVGESY